MRLSAISIYPVKGCRRTELSCATVGRSGLVGDRQWMVVQPNGRFLTQRTHPALARIVPRLTDGGIELAHPERATLAVDVAGADRPIAVIIWGRRATARDAGDAAADWLTAVLGVESRLVTVGRETRMMANRAYVGERDVPLAFADGFPVLLCNSDSLDDLNRRLGAPVPMERFRPNLVISGLGPFGEDGIRRLRIGAVELRIVKPCTRCVVPSVDQTSGEHSSDPTPVLKTFRYDRVLKGVTFGVNATVESPPGAVIAVGDPVDVLEAAGPPPAR
ncbi:MAG TPA: MOSC N-terminal beta barrel domain-containing protein [Steroidobacteraceae bacterium]|nr:MOSC N-terminal beta barrel domain-containing protein [Steroidobacteraceae bacterium]